MQNRGDQGPQPPSAPPPRASDDPWNPAGSEGFQRLAWRAAPPEPGPGPWMRVGIAAMAVLVIVAFATVAVFIGGGSPVSGPSAAAPVVSVEPHSTPTPGATRYPTPTPTRQVSAPTAPTTTPDITVSPEPGGRAWSLPDRHWDPLPEPDPASELYPLQATAIDDLPSVTLVGCPEPATVTTEDQWKAAVRDQWSCVHRAWVPVYRQLGWSTVEPEVAFYPGAGSKSECGYLSAPAFYCSSGAGTVYFGQEHMQMATSWDLSINEMVNHEYGHHLQKLAGITEAKLALPAQNELERRSELQATCWSAMLTYHNRSFGFNADDLDSWRGRLDTMLIDDVHGNRGSLTHWGLRGLYAATVGECNTWVAPAEDVA